MRDLNDLLFFAAVVENSGFSAAARALKVPKSSVSRRLGRLESRLGVRLMERSTRHVRLTEIGTIYYAKCRAALADLDSADEELAELRSNPIGIVRVSCPIGLAQSSFGHMLPRFLLAYPQVRVQVIVTNRPIDLVDERIDVAIRVRLQLPDESLAMRHLRSDCLTFVASPAFVAQHAISDDPSDLDKLPLLSFQQDTARPSWTLRGPRNTKQTVTFEPILWTSDFNLLIEAAGADAGVALLPTHATDLAIREGRLVRVLSDWQSEDVNIHLVFTKRRGLAPPVRVFIDYLVEHFKVKT